MGNFIMLWYAIHRTKNKRFPFLYYGLGQQNFIYISNQVPDIYESYLLPLIHCGINTFLVSLKIYKFKFIICKQAYIIKDIY